MKCHQRYRQNIFGLIHGLLHKTNKNASYEDSIDFLMSFLNLSAQTFTADQQEHYLLNNRYNKSFQIKKKKVLGDMWLRKDIQKSLIIPADYYIKRKYSTQTIAKYDIGVHRKNGRIYIPIYNNDYTFAVGFTSRSPYEKCEKCKKWHNPSISCPTDNKKDYEKWVNSPQGFPKNEHLFNYWFAHPYIKKSKIAVIVEGPGDVLKLEDNNIHNSVATLGTSLCEEQKLSLERLGVTTLVCLYDNDDAGKNAKTLLQQQFSRNFYLYFPSFNSKDVGDATKEELTFIKDYITKL
jgi:5S rRNA maturation endonuclease (ribonuclease M5)